MNKLICILIGAGLLAACEQKSTTVNPTTEKTDTTIVKEKEAAPPDTKSETKTETNINLNTSPAPSP